jgi:hypothetical protein
MFQVSKPLSHAAARYGAITTSSAHGRGMSNLATVDKPATSRITARVRVAILAMVHEGLHRRDAAAKAGLAEHSLYQALRRPLVRALYNSELDVLRTSARARTFHRLEQLRDQDRSPTAAVKACQVLEAINDEVDARPRGTQTIPGFVIVINAPSAHMPRPPTIEATPVLDDAVEHQRELVPVKR